MLQGLQNFFTVSYIPRQPEKGEVTGVDLTGVGARDDGPALEGVEGSREVAISCLSGVVASEGHYVLCSGRGRSRVEEGRKGVEGEGREREGEREEKHAQSASHVLPSHST